MTVPDPFTVEYPTGRCPVCGHEAPLLLGQIERHKERRFKASKGGIYVSDDWCRGYGMAPEPVVEPEGAAA